ncbi:hypothetical protein KTD13_01865 [Burkholderia multivorans]|uniref:hypothetical protein n=1 Tax=Burkholderia multivorans TaxID=87883 RepID=UPI001C244FE1|nr:hypothetical protein [Burkholderia multivorans]MBU9259093.1 hypothetical protein [Burkholderia multivorans]
MTKHTSSGHSPEEQMFLGAQAKQILENPAFQEAIRRLSKHFFEEWAKTAPDDVATRERLYAHVSVQRSFFNCLHSVLGDGQVSTQAMQSAKSKTR